MDFTIDIARPPERVFALIADLPSYPRWLPPSGLYGSTTQVSETPVTLGTTYVDGKQAKLRGRVTEYQPPFAIAFHQESRLLLSRLAIDIRYRLEPLGAGTRVHRTTTPQMRAGLGRGTTDVRCTFGRNRIGGVSFCCQCTCVERGTG